MNSATVLVRVADTERDERHEYVFLRSPIRVGRSQQNELALEHAFVSHCHGLILFDSDGVSFIDIGSTNGSFLDGTRLDKDQRVPLSGSTVITIGALRLEARLETRLEPSRALTPATDLPQRSALLNQRFAQFFIELRRGQHELLRALGLPVPRADKLQTLQTLQTIDSAGELLSYLLDPTASHDRVDELSSAYADLMRHELALVSAIGAGCRELLDELSPSHLAPEGLGGVAGWVARLFGHDARWRRLEAKSEELQEQAALSSLVLGRSFARAYVEARARSGPAPGHTNHGGPTAAPHGAGARAETRKT